MLCEVEFWSLFLGSLWWLGVRRVFGDHCGIVLKEHFTGYKRYNNWGHTFKHLRGFFALKIGIFCCLDRKMLLLPFCDCQREKEGHEYNVLGKRGGRGRGRSVCLWSWIHQIIDVVTDLRCFPPWMLLICYSICWSFCLARRRIISLWMTFMIFLEDFWPHGMSTVVLGCTMFYFHNMFWFVLLSLVAYVVFPFTVFFFC